MTQQAQAILAYWEVCMAMHSSTSTRLTTSDALKKLNQSQDICPTHTSWRIKGRAHTLKYDIIEGTTEWRPKPQHNDNPKIISISIASTRR